MVFHKGVNGFFIRKSMVCHMEINSFHVEINGFHKDINGFSYGKQWFSIGQ